MAVLFQKPGILSILMHHLHSDEKPTDADFEKAIGDYLTFEFSMIMQNRDYLFKNGGGDIAEV